MISLVIKLESTDGEKFQKDFAMPEDFPVCKTNKSLEDIVTKYIARCGLDRQNTEKCEIRAKFEW